MVIPAEGVDGEVDKATRLVDAASEERSRCVQMAHRELSQLAQRTGGVVPKQARTYAEKRHDNLGIFGNSVDLNLINLGIPHPV